MSGRQLLWTLILCMLRTPRQAVADRGIDGVDACPISSPDLERSQALIQQARRLHSSLSGNRRDSKNVSEGVSEVEASLISCISKALINVPPCARLYLLGDAFRREGDILRAVRMLKAARHAAPNFPAPLAQLNRLFARRQAIGTWTGAGDFENDLPKLSTSPRKGVIVYLVSTREEDVSDLSHSLRLLHLNFFHVHSRCYDVIIFHDGLTQRQREYLLSGSEGLLLGSNLSCPLIFHAVDLRDIPAGAAEHALRAVRDAQHPNETHSRTQTRTQGGGSHGTSKFSERGEYGGLGGYRYMCRFECILVLFIYYT